MQTIFMRANFAKFLFKRFDQILFIYRGYDGNFYGADQNFQTVMYVLLLVN